MIPRLSIVVCTYNHAARLTETLRCLNAQDASPTEFEVVVVNNNCTDHTSAVVAAAAVREVHELRAGHVHARVRGVRESRAEWIAFVDDDNFLAPDWIRLALRFIDSHADCGVFGGRVEIAWEMPPLAAVARRAYAFAETDLADTPTVLRGDDRWRLRGAGLVCRRQALLRAGWLDWQMNVGRIERGTLAGDDTELVMRISREGYQVGYEPACRLRHWIGAERLGIGYLRALHRGFALADPLLLGLRDKGSFPRWVGRFGLLLARRVFALGRHASRGLWNADARLTTRLALDELGGILRGIRSVVRLSPVQRRAWLGHPAPTSPSQPRTDSVEQPGGSAPANTPFQILHLHNGKDYGGLERLLFCLGVCRSVVPAMQPMFALGYHHRLARELTRAGARLEILGEIAFSNPLKSASSLLRLARLLRRERFAAVVCHGSEALASYGWIVRLVGVPLVFWMHSDTKVRNKNLGEFLAGRVRPSLAICNSAFTAESLPLLFSVVPPHLVLHCPVSPPPVQPDAAQRRLQLRAENTTSPDAAVIILPSRLEMWKGHGVLLEALCHLKQEPGWTCWMVGGPFNRAQEEVLQTLRAIADAGGISDRVRFLGQRDDVPELLAAADLFCQPNLTPEPFGINAVEALYAALPVVASDLGGTREIVNASCGLLLAPGNSLSLSVELRRLIRDPALRRSLGTQGPACARAISDPAKILTLLSETVSRLGKTSFPCPARTEPLNTLERVSRG